MSVFDLSDDVNLPGGARVLDRCEQLATISSMEQGIYRAYLTPEHKKCHELVSTWIREAGMSAWSDPVGNCWGHYPGLNEKAPTVILGSHLDTVVDAGKYDGVLGVLAAIELVDRLHRHSIHLPFAIEVVGFADEEGARFGATLLGSKAVVGQWQREWFSIKDAQGITLAEAMTQYGLNPERVFNAERSPNTIKAYLELHIEQGPVLVKQNLPVGIVTSIAGARRFNITLHGTAGHAGTVPMELRRDALVTTAMAIQLIEKIARRTEVLATVGKVEAHPGSVNVIPGKCEFSLDVRSSEDKGRDQGIDTIFRELGKLCRERSNHLSIQEIHNAPAVKCASWIQQVMEEVIEEQGMQVISMMSGAGHDAMAFGDFADMGMLFVRCAEGVSHHPAESVSLEDVNIALNVFYGMLIAMSEQKTSVKCV